MGNIDFRIAGDGTIIRGDSNKITKPHKKSKTWLIVLLLLLVAGSGIGVGYYLNNQKRIEQQFEQPVEVVAVEAETVSGFPNSQRITELINNYYAVFETGQYYKLDNYFAETVYRYFEKSNVKGTSIKNRQRKYNEETLKTKSVSFSIRWDTFTQQKISNDVVEVSFILDYYLNTERYGNQYYVLKIKMDINSDYKIVSIGEDIIERQKL